MKPTEITRVIRSSVGSGDVVKRFGRFRALIWPNIQAREEANRLMLRTDAENRDDTFWSKFYGYCDNVCETPNVAVKNGVSALLRYATDISTSVYRFDSDHAFLGVGNGNVIGQLNAAVVANGSNDQIEIKETPDWSGGNNYNTYALSIAVGDILLFTDSTTAPPSTAPFPPEPTNPEYAEVEAVSSVVSGARTITLTKPVRYNRSIDTYVVVSGRSNAVALSASGYGSDTAYKKVNSSYPIEGIVSGYPTLTWQVDFATTEAQFHWVEACIGSASAPDEDASSTIPSDSTLLAKAAWYPSPLLKGGVLASQQYLFSIG